MSAMRSGAAFSQIRRLFGLGTVSGLTEWQLLDRYASGRDESAFAALVDRHGPMVLGVCRRLLRDPEDVDDAFQATFLVLARKAGALGPGDALGGWLHGVARRVALRSRSESARRRARERPSGGFERFDPVGATGLDVDDLRPVLDEELGRLPADYRAAVVLCYLEGRTHEEAAGELGWPVGTVKGRLARARDLLRARLTRRGVTLASAALSASLANQAKAVAMAGSVPATLSGRTVKAAAGYAAGRVSASLVAAPVARLVEGVLWTMLANKLKLAAGVVAASAFLVAAVGSRGFARVGPRTSPSPSPSAVAKPAGPGRPATAANRAPASAGGFASREVEADAQSLETAREGYRLAVEAYKAKAVDEEAVHNWSTRLAEVESRGGPSPPADARGHLSRMTDLEDLARRRRDAATADASEDDPKRTLRVLAARFYREEAERQAKNPGQPRPATAPPTAPAVGDGPEPGKDARSLAILKKLDEPVSMNFANETPLDDVLKYIKEATAGSGGKGGVAIYVDPAGLQEADKTMTSPVALELEGVPLKRTLSLLLKQLGLSYIVEDGMIYITAERWEHFHLPPAVGEETALTMLQTRAERGEMTASERKAFIDMLKDMNEIAKLQRQYRNGGEVPKPGGGGGSFQ